MICPFCLHKKNEVYNSRNTKNNTVVWRRRRCLGCGQSFTTQETFDPSGTWHIKKDGHRPVPYARPTLAMSLLRVCDHRTNADASVWYLLDLVEQRLLPIAAKQQMVLESATIAEVCGTVLKRYDPAAYVKYLSYHQPTMDASTLRKQLRR